MSAEAGTYDHNAVGLTPAAIVTPDYGAPDVSRETSPDEPGPDLIDANELAESLTGFDQIAIRQRFGATFADLAAEELMLLRVLLFISFRRGDGSGRRQTEVDKDAYQKAMELPVVVARELFADQDPGAGLDESATAERDRQFADFVTVSGIPYTVEQYMALTMGQKNAVYDAASKRR